MDRRLRLLLLVSLAACLAPLAQAAVPPSYHVAFDLATETYNDFYNKLSTLLRQTSVPRHDVYGRPVLGPRRPVFHAAPPQGWIMVDISLGDAPATEKMTTTLAMAPDDLCIFGFRNNAGAWYAFDGYPGVPGNATALPFSLNYFELVGGHQMLYTVPLGKKSATQAAWTLATYDVPAAASSDGDEQLKQAVARLAVMVSEAMRFRVIREEFSGWWEEETFITEEEASYVVCWGRLSMLLVKWQQSDGLWSGPVADDVASEIKIRTGFQALRLVDFLLRP
ncbi:hypothetical protein ACP70R_007350 [Stipagrostis hirtigluma subsp. patula]